MFVMLGDCCVLSCADAHDTGADCGGGLRGCCGAFLCVFVRAFVQAREVFVQDALCCRRLLLYLHFRI